MLYKFWQEQLLVSLYQYVPALNFSVAILHAIAFLRTLSINKSKTRIELTFLGAKKLNFLE